MRITFLLLHLLCITNTEPKISERNYNIKIVLFLSIIIGLEINCSILSPFSEGLIGLACVWRDTRLFFALKLKTHEKTKKYENELFGKQMKMNDQLFRE